MTTQSISMTCAALLLGGSVMFAQTPPPTSPPARPTAPAKTSAQTSKAPAMTVTLEGCLQRALPSAADPSGFELLGARAQGASGLADTPGTYKVKAPATMDLSAHVNHKVQITGTLMAPSSRTARDTAGDTTSRDLATQDKARGVLRAEKVEMIADSCSAT